MSNKLTKFVKDLRSSAKKHSPEILMGVGIAGMITSTVMAVRATPKALMLIEDEKRKQNYERLETAKSDYAEDYFVNNPIESLALSEVVKLTWKCYIPAIFIGGLSIACLISSSSVNLRRNAALATAYSLSESALKEYQEKVIEEVGEKKEKHIRDEIAKDRIEKHPVTNSEVIITGKGQTLCCDILSKRYFKSDIETIRKTVNDLNRQMLLEDYISLNDFYYALGLEPTKQGNDLGWRVDKGYIDLDFSSQLTKDGVPCLVIDYFVAPQHDYMH